VASFHRVRNKNALLARVAEASLNDPDGAVREVVFPVAGGEATLRQVVAEARAASPEFRRNVQVKLRASYSHHYRVGMVKLLRTLAFRSNNTAHAPIIAGIALVLRHAESKLQSYPSGEVVPLEGIVGGDWTELAYRSEPGTGRVVRTVYEVCLFRALRERLRCKEIWVQGADRWRNPEEDLPADFDVRRTAYYSALSAPLDPMGFIEPLRMELTHELHALHDALPELGWLTISPRGGGRITLTPLQAEAEPRNLRRLKDELRTRWGLVPLLDMLKETVLRVGLVEHFAPTGARGGIDRGVLAERLILCIFGYGTNIGLRAIAAGEHGHTEDDLRYVRVPLPLYRGHPRVRRGDRQRHLRRPRRADLGRRDWRGRIRLDALRGVRPEPVHPAPRPLRRPRRAHLLARRHQVGGDPLAADHLHRLGGRGDDRGRDAPPHRHGRRGQLCRLARPVRDRVRANPAARVRAQAAAQADQPHQAARPRRRDEGPDPGAGAGAGRARPDPLGPDRAAVRPAGPLRHRDQQPHRLHRGDPAPVHPRRDPPHLPGLLEVGRAQRTIFLCRYLRSRAEQREVNAGLRPTGSRGDGVSLQVEARTRK
jgi:Tn3 transposase DDE domain